jgi:hypothetical protein
MSVIEEEVGIPSGLIDPFGRNLDKGVIEWMRVGPPDNRMYHLSCRHAETTYYERDGNDSEGVILSRLVSQHHERANQSEFSYKGRWMCFCEPHKAPGA